MTLCAINLAAVIYYWTAIIITPLPAIMIGISFSCSLMYLIEPKTKPLACITYLSMALIFLLGMIIAIYIRRPIGFLVSFSAGVIICKNFLASGTHRKKDKLRTKIASGICIAAIIILVGCSAYTFALSKRDGLSNGQETMWGAECAAVFDDICADAGTDEDVAHAAYDWIRSNLTYDDNLDLVYQYFDCKNTLITKTGVCYDFANLFAAICRSQGVPCFCVNGDAKRNLSVKHTFNRVFFNGSWWTVDVTHDTSHADKQWGFMECQSLNDPDELYYITKIY